MDTQEYVKKANEILVLLENYSMFSKNNTSLDELIMDTELLLYKYDKNYPSLFEVKSLKERYSDRYWQYESTIKDTIALVLNKFKNFLESE